MNEIIYSVNHIDTCTPSYFSGSHLPVVQVMVDNCSSYRSIKEGLLDWQATDHIEELDVEAYKVAVEELFDGIDLASQPKAVLYLDSPLNEEDEYFENVYMFFTIETVDGE